MTEMHPDPIGDSGQKAAQYAQILIMAAEAFAVIGAARARAGAERDQHRADAINTDLAANHKGAADLWQPLLGDHKRDKLDVAQTLTAWSAAQAWREHDPDADRASDLAEDRLHDLRPAAMMRYDDLRNQGVDPVSAMRQVVPLLETNPRVGEQAVRAGELTATVVDVVNVTAGDIDAGRMPDTEQTRYLADELNAEHDGYQPPYGLSGYELTYGVEDRMAQWPHQHDGAARPAKGSDYADVSRATEPATTAAETVAVDSWAIAPGEATAMLVVESALLSEMEAHREVAARRTTVADAEQKSAVQLSAIPDDPATRRVDEHLVGVDDGRPHLSVVAEAGSHAHIERDAAQAIAASFPTAVSDVSTAMVSSAAYAAPASEMALAKQATASRPSLVARR